MQYYNINKMYRSILVLFILLITGNTFLYAQQNNDEIKGYGSASYKIAQAGTFMKTWLVAGPFAVSDGIEPNDSLQEKAFKTDIISDVQVEDGKTISPITVNQKDFRWQVVSQRDDIIDLDTFYTGKDFV